MRTMHRSDQAVAASPRRGSDYWLFGVVAFFALLLGVVAGWQIFGGQSEVEKAGGGDLSAREQQMVEVVEEYRQAWLDADAEAVESFFVPGGYVVFNGFDYAVEDGSLERFVDSQPTWPIEFEDPTLVRGNVFLGFHDISGGIRANLITFTSSGDPLIVSHIIE